jgi:triosephosphate isomerase (TIM)
MKNLWIIANWKSNKNEQETLEWLNVAGPQLPRTPHIKVIVCPKYSDLTVFKKEVDSKGYPIIVGAQNISAFPKGAYTGEEAAEDVKGIISHSIVGHSERREKLHEDDALIAQKVERCIENGITPIVCVQSKDTPIPKGNTIIAYEPVFAIGSGTPDTPDNAEAVAKAIREGNFSYQVLYGGSVKSSNVRSFVIQPNISGVLVGGASLDPQEFVHIVQACI